METRVLGRHVLLDMELADTPENKALMTDNLTLRTLLLDTLAVFNINVLHVNWHDFGEGMGYTIVVLLAESHASIHTWPEYNRLAFDLFTCGASNPNVITDALVEKIKPKVYYKTSVERKI